jgi:hypothetical protein
MRRGLLGGLAALVLAGCSGGTQEPSTILIALDRLGQSLARSDAPQAERPPLTRAALDVLDGAFLEATIEDRDLLAYLFVNAEREDDGPGPIVVWRTDDDITLTLRGGVLVATRGLGRDIISAGTLQQPGRPGPAPGTGQRQIFLMTGGNQVQTLTLACEVTDLGPETIVIVERAHPTRHLRETCQGGGGAIVNDYWVDAARGLVWQSRQWAGPQTGYMRFRQLTP